MQLEHKDGPCPKEHMMYLYVPLQCSNSQLSLNEQKQSRHGSLELCSL